MNQRQVNLDSYRTVTPAKAGVQAVTFFRRKVKGWIPAFAGMTTIGCHILSCVCISMGCLLLYSSVYSAQKDFNQGGKVSGSFLDVTPSVRLAALGGDQVAAHGDVGSFYSNPASLGSLQIPELMLSHNQSFIETKYEALGFAVPFRNQAMAFSAHYMNDGSQERTRADANGDLLRGLGSFRFSTTLLHLGWARRLNDRLSLGGVLKGWHEDRDQTSSKSWASDVGFLAQSLFSIFDMGVVYRNLGPSKDRNPLPRSLVVGLAWHLLPRKTMAVNPILFSEMDFLSERSHALRLGLELKNKNVWLRGGYQNLTQNVEDTLSQLSFGGGFRLKGLKLDYAWSPHAELGDQHRFALTMGFGLTVEEKKAAAQELDRAMQKRVQDRADLYFTEGQKAAKSGDWTLAHSKFSQTLMWEPGHQQAAHTLKDVEQKLKVKHVETLLEEGERLAQQNQWLDAALRWQQVLKIDGEQPKAKKMAQVAKEKIQHQRQTSSPNTEVERDYNNGIDQYLNGNYEAALNDWNEVARLAPDRPFLREYMEKAEKMKLQQELSKVKKTIPSKEQQTDTLAQQAYTLYTLGQLEKAILVWQKILVIDPENKEAKTGLKEAQKKKDLVGGSHVKEVSTVDLLNGDALMAYNEGKLAQAASLWRQALDRDPHNIWIKNNLQRVESELAGKNER